MSQVEYILGLWQPPSGHSVGVNSVNAAENFVVSGGRDGRICGWAPGNSKPVLQYDAHANWVNKVLPIGQNIWSCSADTTVKLWSGGEVHTIGAHRDYAWTLAQCGDTILSAGLDGAIIGWGQDGKKTFENTVEGPLSSIYALAAAQNHYVSGGPDSLVRLWDPRSDVESQVFKGHSDNVRSLLVNDEWIVSASSDCTVRLWSLKAGRLFKTYTQHASSVFSLYSGDNLQSWYSGDRKGKIWKTELATAERRLVADQGTAVRSITEFDGLWTGAKSMRYWEPAALDTMYQKPGIFVGAECPKALPIATQPPVELPPSDCLIKSLLLNDKRRVLIAASNGQAALIDILRGQVLEQLPAIDPAQASEQLSELAEKYNTQDVLDNWCQVGIRAGKLVISLEERSAGTTEVYADEFSRIMGVDIGECDDERRVNIGKMALQALFAKFIAAELPKLEQQRASVKASKQQLKEQKEAEKAKQPEQKRERSRFRSMFGLRKKDDTPERPKSPSTTKASHKEKDAKRESYDDVYEAAVDLDGPLAVPPPFEFPDDTIVLISRVEPGAGASTVKFECLVKDMTTEAHLEGIRLNLPAFAGEALWLPRMSSRQPARIGFNVVPFSSEFPEIVQNKSRLLANPVLRARKAMAYVISSLKESGHLKDLGDVMPDDVVELYCNDELLSPLMTLALIRTRIWRNGGDVLLKYKLKTSLV